MGPQNPSFRLGRKPEGRTGNQRVRVLVVEKYWEADIGRTYRSVLVRRNAARRCVEEVPSPKETVTPLDENPDDGGRQREGENGAQTSRGSFKRSFARKFDSGAAKPARAKDTVSGASGSTPATP
jgi:hypothetical protein